MLSFSYSFVIETVSDQKREQSDGVDVKLCMMIVGAGLHNVLLDKLLSLLKSHFNQQNLDELDYDAFINYK